ncbi:hypothetical protein [Streptomyces subrutilus]|uniref:hypothetical protein n=1 Tax=Streptomyces subrutilus TaxID=36818 RepID=UPI002E133A9C|nr:hypothetical protein OG479_13220 [Streptomyces subrutilus]
MSHCIARLLEPLLRFLRVTPPPAPGTRLRPQGSPYRPPRDHRDHARRQRARRVALWLALHGVDIGPRVIHGRVVAA